MTKPKLTDSELDAILAETRTEFEAILATAEAMFPLPLLEDFDITALTAGMGLDKPIDTADLDALLTKPSAPARPPVPTTPPAAHDAPVAGTVKISVRIPARILIALKARAAELRRPYQRVLNRALSDAVKGWESPAAKAGHV